MIPNRISLSGFLCYREPQEACFEGRTLWMLAGPNGSGKSAIFDAITYAMFGQHRGGRQNARGLIHHACDGFTVEFEFSLDDKRYRARRTLSRQGRGTRQIELWDGPAGAWQVIAQTQTEKGFAQWVDTHVALTYDTFTASVLLLQGRAENLLLAAPAERHRLLAQLVGLDRIETLHQAARQHANKQEGAAKSLQQHATRLPTWSVEQLDQLHRTVQTTDAACENHRAALGPLSQLLEQSRQGEELTAFAERLQQEIQQLEPRLNQLQRTECQHARSIDLENQLKSLTQWAQSAQRIATCRTALATAQAHRDRLTPEWQQLNAAIGDGQRLLFTTRQELAAALTREKSLAAQRSESEQAHIAAVRYCRARERLRTIHQCQAELERQLTLTQTRQAEIGRDEPTDQAVSHAHQAVQEVAAQLAVCEAIADRLQEQLQRFRTLSAHQVCPHCLQPLSPAHIQHEDERLCLELKKRQEQVTQTRNQLQELETDHRVLLQQHEEMVRQRKLLEHEAQTLDIRAQAICVTQQECVSQWRQARQELPLSVRQQVPETPLPDSLTAHYPTTDDLTRLKESNQRITRQLTDTCRSVRTLQQQIERLETDLQRDSARHRSIEQQLREWNDRLANETGRLAGLATSLDDLRPGVPALWREMPEEQLQALIREMAAERDQLGTVPTDPASADLPRVRARLLACHSQRDLVLQQLFALPAQSRCVSHEWEQAIQAETQALADCEAALRKAREAESRALAERDSRLATERTLRKAHQLARLWNRLATLLGREGLQRDLLRTAESAIVQYANAMLDRLASGQLYVELAQPTAGRAGAPKVLDLLAHTTGEAAAVQDVAFLSGSQKFRVAVALSLAIGQFASNARRPVQAVIIDEGFGCLDTVNRQVMIQELQNLQGYLKRIVLVTHQDEFAAAFADGYHCELVDGTTQLTPFHP